MALGIRDDRSDAWLFPAWFVAETAAPNEGDGQDDGDCQYRDCEACPYRTGSLFCKPKQAELGLLVLGSGDDLAESSEDEVPHVGYHYDQSVERKWVLQYIYSNQRRGRSSCSRLECLLPPASVLNRAVFLFCPQAVAHRAGNVT